MTQTSSEERLVKLEVKVENIEKTVLKVDGKLDKIIDGRKPDDWYRGVDDRLQKLESKNDIKNTLLWVGLVASAIINVILVYQTFTGR